MAEIPEHFTLLVGSSGYYVERIPNQRSAEVGRSLQPVWAYRIEGQVEGERQSVPVDAGETFAALKNRIARAIEG